MDYEKILKHLQGEPLDQETAEQYLQLVYDACHSSTAHILGQAFTTAAQVLKDGWKDKTEEEQVEMTKAAFAVLSDKVKVQLQNLAIGAMKLGESFGRANITIDIKIPGLDMWASELTEEKMEAILSGISTSKKPEDLN